jgi:HAD superfamily hydrolase (TIGR01509 family)
MSTHPYRAILWDNDGVLVDTEQCYFEACRETLAQVAIDLTEAMYFDYWLASDRGMPHVSAGRGLTDQRIMELKVERDASYERRLEERSLAIAGVREVLCALRPHFTMGIVTSSRRHHLEAIHRRTGFLELFDFTLTEEDYLRSKPHPDPYLAGIARTGLRPDECLAIEDAPRGLAAARAAGLDCWVIPTPLTAAATFAGAARVLGSIAEVATLLLSIG